MADTVLGEKLRERRKEKGLTLHQLSKLSGAHYSYLARVEKGERRPSALILRTLAEPLDFTEVELLKLSGYLSPDETDERIARVKDQIKGEILDSMIRLLEKIDSL